MRRRLRKQITVVAILGAFFSGVGALIFFAVYEPPPPPPPPPPTFLPLVARSAQILRGPQGQADLVATVQNPNPNAGVRAIKYVLTVPGAGEPTTIPGETFFLPGQEKVIAHVNVALPAEASGVTITLGDPEWVPVSADFRGPQLLTVSRESSIRDGAEPTYVLKGVLANESERDFLTVEVTAIGLDAEGTLVGVGRTFIGSLLSLERREFTVAWPLPVGAVIAEVRAFPEVNVFSPTAVQPRSGLPGGESGRITAPTPTGELREESLPGV